MALIRNGRLVPDTWRDLDDDGPLEEGLDLIVSLARWRRDRDALKAACGRLGVRLRSDELAGSLRDDLHCLDLVVVDFPKFNDGRGFSTARLLRQRYGFAGEIRARGHLIQDQYLFLDRCGVSAIEVSDQQTALSWLAAIGEIGVFYQPVDSRRASVLEMRQTAGDQTVRDLCGAL